LLGQPSPTIATRQLTSRAYWRTRLGNRNPLGPELCVGDAYGPGINMLKLESEVGGRLAEAKDNGVVIIACGNTMKGQKLAPGDRHPAARIVPAGVVEIIKRQKEGYAYIRP
jgi:hypothetical protein